MQVSAVELTPISLQLKWTHQFQFAGYYAAKELGYYEEEGLDVEIYEFNYTDAVVDKVVNGEVDFGIGDSTILAEFVNGQPIVALSAIIQENPLALFAKKSSNISKPSDLIGKKVMFDKAGVGGAAIQAMLIKQGINPSKYVSLEHDYNYQGLIDVTVDAISGYLTGATYFYKSHNIPINIIKPQSYGVNFYGDILFTSQQMLKQNPETVEKFKKASLKGWDYAVNHTDEIINIILTKYNKTLTYDALHFEAQEMIKLMDYPIIEVGHMHQQRWEHVADVFKQQGMIKKEVDFTSFIYNPAITSYFYLILPLLILSLLLIAWSFRNHFQHRKLIKNLERLNFAFGTANQGWFDLNVQTGAISVSDEYSRLLGFDPAHFHTDIQEWKSNLYPEDREKVLTMFEESLATGDVCEMEYRRKTKDGDWLWLHTVGQVIEWDKKGQAVRGVGVHTDISTRKQAELKLIDSESHLQEAQRYAHIGYWELLRDSSIATWSEQMFIIFGLPPEVESGPETLCDILHASDCANFMESLQHSFATGEEHHIEYRITRRNDGEERWIECRGKPVIDSNGEIEKISGFIQDITERKRGEEKLQLSARVFSETNEGITITNAQKEIVDVNPAFCEITGYSREEILGQNPRILSSGKQSPQFYADMWLNIDKYGHWQGEIWNRTKSGEVYAELLNISTILDGNDKVINYVGVFTDITHSKHQQEELSRMAHYDVLTQLPNRTLLSDRFHQATAHSKRSGHQLAVCFLDLDKFKPINDTYGHKVGDELLKNVATRLKESIRAEDTVSRQGGDEFALLLGEIESFSHCEQFLDRLLETIAQPYLIDGVSHTISASCGITLYPFDDADLDTLLRHADHAMYQAKQAGRNRHRLFSVEDDAFFSEKQQRISEIEQALINNEFSLYYQPKVHMLTGEVFGVEALIRWIHPEKGLIPPLDFLPVLEDTEVELKVGDWVINQALVQLNDWNNNGIKLEVSVNISSHHLQSKHFYSQLEKALEQYPSVDSKSLQLEILESSALGDLETVSGIIKTCQEALGVNIALDDFGTGYSSLTHLRNLTANTIKIDQSFVRDVLDDPSDYAIIEGVIGLANAFNREIIAEGVETTEHGLMLLIMGCVDAQGYGIAKPMPAKDVSGWLSSYQPNKEWLLFASKFRTVKENKLAFFQLITEHWINHFTANITSPPERVTQWPNMNERDDHCGQWIKREKQGSLFDNEDLQNLEQAHEDFHLTAQSLQVKYQDGDIDSAREDLSELQTAFDKMNSALA